MNIPVLLGWITATEASQQLGVSRQAINKMIRHGHFESAHRVGQRLYLLRIEEVDRMVRERQAPEPDAEEPAT